MGILVDAKGYYDRVGPITVFLGASPFGTLPPLQELKQRQYESVDAMLADGWVVD
jgi:hypothetical protein